MSTIKLTLRIAISLLVSGVLIFFSLRHVGLRTLVAVIATANPLPVLGYLAILLVVHLVKTLRWGLLLAPLGHVSFRRLNSASAIGFMLMVRLPSRLGELARPLLVSRPMAGGGGPIRRRGARSPCAVGT